MAQHNDTGKHGEAATEQYLLTQGYVILEKNWRKGRLEVDLVCLSQDILVFVEVKTRKSLQHGLPQDSVTPKKEQHLLDAAEKYLEEHDLDYEVRFDIVAVWQENGKDQIHHICNAFGGMG